MSAARGSVIKRGKTWSVVLDLGRDEAGKRIRRWHSGFATKKAAEQARTDLLGKVDRNEYVAPTAQTVREFITADWLPSLDAQVAGGSMKASSVSFYRTLATSHVVPRIGDVPLARLDAPTLNKLYGSLLTSGRRTGKGKGGPLSPTTVHSVHVTISRMLSDAEKWGKVPRNVATKAEAPTPTASKGKWWTAEQLRTFDATVADDRLSALWALAMDTGMRRGELAGLRWSDVSLETRRLTIASTRVVVGYEVMTTTPKTKKSARTIALSAPTVAALRGHHRRQLEERMAWGKAWTDTGLVFVAENGEGLHPERLLRLFQQATRRAGLPPMPLHGLRHSYASAGVAAGVSMKVMSERLGHSSLAITADLYSHVAPEVDQDAADRTSAFIFGEGK
jgi:integrase